MTLLLLAMPWLVIVGLFMLVLPGLIHGIVPREQINRERADIFEAIVNRDATFESGYIC